MDSLTQAVLGASVGHAVAGKTLGRRAALWGAVAGTLPDLDVLAYPFLDQAGQLQVHRGLTHGLAFGLVVGPLVGWLAWRLSRRRPRPGRDPGDWRAWGMLWTLALVTHPLLDVCTIYGTQLLAPFSDRPFAIGNLFIIDPFYTLPLFGLLAVALVRRRPRVARAGLVLSTLYLGWSLVAFQTVRQRAETAFAEADRVLVTPMPLQTLLWRVEVEADGHVASYRHALLRPGVFRGDDAAPEAPGVPLAALPAPDSRGSRTLNWFSRGWLVQPPGGPPDVVADARFGRGPDGAYVFRWRVHPDGSFRQLPFGGRVSGAFLRDLAREALALDP